MIKQVVKAMVLLTFVVMLTGCAGGKQEVPKGQTMSNLKISTDAEADKELEAYVDEAFELLKENGEASEAVWPGYDLSQNAILVCLREDADNKITHAWKLTTTEKSSLTNEQLSGLEIPASGTYNNVEFEGKKSIIISFSKNTLQPLKDVAVTNFIYEIGVHEMYHFHYESFFKLAKLAVEQKMYGGRGTAFPKAAEPRVYRKLLYDNLAAAFEHPGDEADYFGRAKYWNEKWKTEFPGEYYQAKITDIMEGKARYIQYMMCIPQDNFDAEKEERIKELFDKSIEPSVSIDSESYKLGFAAGVLLDRQDPDWKQRITKKPEPPVEYLLKNVEVVIDDSSVYEEKLSISKSQMSEINKEVEVKLEDIKKAESDKEIPFLLIKEKYLVGSFETSDFLNYKDKNLVIDFGGTFESENGTMVISRSSVYEETGWIKGSYILPLTMEYEVSGERLRIDNGKVSGDILVKQTKDKDGRIIYTMK